MKANKFLIAFALCVGFSSTITLTSQTPPPSWGQSIRERITNWWNGATTQAKNARDYTVISFKSIPQTVMNRVSQWQVNTQQVLLGALVTSLVGLGIYNKDTILDYVGQVADQAVQNPKIAGAIATGAVVAGGAYAYNQHAINSLDAKLLASNFNQKSIDAAFQEAMSNGSISTLKAVLSNRFNNSNTSTEIRSNIKSALENNWQTTQIPAVGTLKQQFVKEIIGTKVNLEI